MYLFFINDKPVTLMVVKLIVLITWENSCFTTYTQNANWKKGFVTNVTIIEIEMQIETISGATTTREHLKMFYFS